VKDLLQDRARCDELVQMNGVAMLQLGAEFQEALAHLVVIRACVRRSARIFRFVMLD
jgi:hypothetical protein